jgi:tetratricopeptide (TPR) repeat protein
MDKSFHRSLALWLIASALFCGCGVETRLDDIHSLQEAGHFAATIGPLRELLEATPDDPELNHLYGVALLETRQPELAIWPLRKAAQHPDWAISDGMLLAQALFQGGSPEDAVQAANRVLELAPDRVDALRLLVDAKMAARLSEEVLVDAERLLALQPDDVGAKVARLVALLNLDRADEAEEALAAVREAAENLEGGDEWQPRVCAATATFTKEKGDLVGAEAMWNSCLEQFPAEETVVFGAIEFFAERSQPARGTEILRRAYDAEPTKLVIIRALSNRLEASGQTDEAERLLLAATQDGVNDREAWMSLADYYEQRGEPEKARDAMAQGMQLVEEASPTLVAAYVDLLIRAGDYDKAEEIISHFEDLPTIANLLRGRLLLARGKPAEALQSLEEGLRLWPDQSVARWLAAQAAEQLGDYDRALAEYAESVRNDPGNWHAVSSLLRLLEAFGRYREAVPVLTRYQREKPRDPEGLVQTIRFASRAGQLDVANQAIRDLGEIPSQAGVLAAEIAALEAARGGAAAGIAVIRNSRLDLTRPRNGRALEALVGYLATEKKPSEALEAVEAALAAHPNEALFHELRARALRVAGEPASAREALERALDLEPERASALAELAALTAERGDADAAIALYDRAYRVEPKEPAYAWEAIQLVLASDGGEEAERRLEALLTRHGTHAAAASLLARRLLERDPERALVLARRAVRFRGGPDAFETLGRLQLQRGDAERAARTLGRSVELRPNAPSTQYWLALALSATGDTEGARAALNAALESDQFPERDDARTQLARLNED